MSSELDKGTTFSFFIDAGDCMDCAKVDCDNCKVVKLVELPSLLELPLRGVRVFLAEDGLDNQKLITYHLKKAGADVKIFDNGLLCYNAICRDGVNIDADACDLLITDMQMPEMDGYTLTSKLRELGWSRPILALTAHAMQGDRERCLAAGCDDYACKPINREALIATCKHSIERAREPRAHRAAQASNNAGLFV